jgi:hypothetical protein
MKASCTVKINSMKIEPKTISDFLKEVKYMVEQIVYTVKLGDDGFKDSILEQQVELNKAIDTFILLNLTKVTEKKTLPQYVRYWDEHDSEDYQKSYTSSENVMLYKGSLYRHIKKELSNISSHILAAVPNLELNNWIETYTIFNGSKFEKMVVSNEWFQASINVVADIVSEIVEARLKAPQQELFK